MVLRHFIALTALKVPRQLNTMVYMAIKQLETDFRSHHVFRYWTQA